MLTIKTNMEYKSLTPLCKTSDPFCERIFGEYELMRASFVPEELLYLVTSQPDVYYNEAPITNIVNDNRVANNQNIKMDVINNMINRLMFSGTVKPTYRDTVYVENVLRKLGITDVKQFLKQVNILESEDAATTKLLELYYSSVDELRTIADEAREEKKKQSGTKDKKDETEKKEQEPALYNEIFNRLDTALIYSELYNMYNPVSYDVRPVLPEQIGMAGDEKFSRNSLLSVFRNYVRNEQLPLTYRSYNVYEEGDYEGTVNNQKSVTNMISSAVLLNHLEKAYRIYSNRTAENKNEWFDYSRTFFGAGRDTFERIRERASRGENVYIYDKNLLEVSSEQKHSEVELLTRLVHLIHEESPQLTEVFRTEGEKYVTEAARQLIEKLGETTVKNQNTTLTENVFNRISADQRTVTGPTEGNVYTYRDMRSRRTDITEGGTTAYYSDRTDIRRDERSFVEGDVDITLNKTEEGDTNVTEGSSEFDSTTINAYKQALEIINEQNLEKLTQLSKIMPEKGEKKKRGEVRLDRSQALLAAEDILSGKSPLEIEYLKEGEPQEKQETVYEKAVMQVMSEETRQIMQVVREYIENPLETIVSGRVMPSEPGALAAELQYLNVGRSEEEVIEGVVEDVTERTVNTVNEISRTKIGEQQIARSDYELENLNLVHKQERDLDETLDFVEELHRQRSEIKKTNEEIKNIVDNVNVTKQNITEKTTVNNETVSMDTVNKMISTRFREDMDEISEKVYDRIEKMLVSERKRRGF